MKWKPRAALVFQVVIDRGLWMGKEEKTDIGDVGKVVRCGIWGVVIVGKAASAGWGLVVAVFAIGVVVVSGGVGNEGGGQG